MTTNKNLSAGGRQKSAGLLPLTGLFTEKVGIKYKKPILALSMGEHAADAVDSIISIALPAYIRRWNDRKKCLLTPF